MMKKNHRTRRVIALIALCLTALIAVTALAEGPLTTLYNSATALLFDTPNATLSAQADFAYNGVHFKHLDGTYTQAGTDSYMNLMLKTPKSDGSIYEGGYTVIGNGTTAYSMDTASPWRYNSSNCGASESILSSSVLRRTILRFGSALMTASETAFQDKIAQTALSDGGTQYHIQLQSGDTPELINAAGTLFAQLAAQKYFYISYDYQPGDSQKTSCDIYYEDYEALSAAVYQRMFGEPLPANFYDLLWGSDEALSRTYYERYTQISDYINQELYDQLREQYDHGVVLVRGDESIQFYETVDEYHIAQGQLSVYYDNRDITFRAFYEAETGTPLSQQELEAIIHSNNLDLINAYSAMLEKMDAKYMELLKQDGRASAIAVAENGSYHMVYDYEAYLHSMHNANQTVTRRILEGMRDLELDETDVTVSLDAQGRITAASGSVRLIVVDEAGIRNTLDVTFTLSCGDYGTSTVETFDPKKYNVMSNEEYYKFIEGGGSLADFLPASQQEENNLPDTVTFGGVKYQVTLENVDGDADGNG